METSKSAASIFDKMAPVYNEHVGQFSTERFYSTVEKLVLNFLPGPAKILDLCCGTGNLIEQLSRDGFSVTGLDISEEMLRYARERAPHASFIHANALDFSLPESFDAVVSLGDSLLHMDNVHKLILVFANVHEALRPGGFFLFDLSNANDFKNNWRSESPAANIPAKLITKKILINQNYSAEEISVALEEVDFKAVRCFDAQKDLGLEQEKGRTFYVARKF
jgi:SAM-dependent methyltransferase